MQTLRSFEGHPGLEPVHMDLHTRHTAIQLVDRCPMAKGWPLGIFILELPLKKGAKCPQPINKSKLTP